MLDPTLLGMLDQSNLVAQSIPSTQEPIASRLIEILKILSFKNPMLQMGMPMIAQTIAATKDTKLKNWITCLNEILKAVGDLDCSEEEYNRIVECPLQQLYDVM